MRRFKYVTQPSEIFGKVRRPLISIEYFSLTRNIWIPLDKVLADTGADISILPRYLGEMIVKDITTGRQVKIKGVVPFSELVCYIHELKARIEEKEFELPVAIADSDIVPVILGRIKGLDNFVSTFIKGEEMVLEQSSY